ANDVAAGFLVELELEQPAGLGLLEQLAEGAEAVGRLGEAGPPALQRLLHHRAPHLGAVAALGIQRLDGLQHEADRLPRRILLTLLLPGVRRRRFLGLARAPALARRAGTLGDELVVEDELVAVADEEIGSRVLEDRKSTRLNSSHVKTSYAVFCLKKK